ncbi:MAG: ribosome biogenesis GTPase Der [Calditrichaeota bacterium]|nr:ribosome biogenesis GTPase Der [Calditrichota bacterium]MCB9366299.1 ribosome biogenesis GTPase Der [Calditrichota bacterium]
MSFPVVAIVGRPNVGKSTIFNRMTRSNRAITSPIPGVTRDRHVGTAEHGGSEFLVMDTGGWVPRSEELFDAAIREQVQFALDECDLILFVGDAQTGPTDSDLEIAQMLNRSDRPVLITVNKADNSSIEMETPAFYTLGLGDPMPISAVQGYGFAELLDKVVETLPDTSGRDIERPRPHVAVVGRPNVGKSSLVNALLGEQRHMVTDIAGTTRDAIDSVVRYYKQPLTLVDTAGLRRKARVTEALEFYTTVRTQKALKDCDVAVVMIEAQAGLLAQDVRILQEAALYGKGVLLCLNKWDLVEKDERTAGLIAQEIDERLSNMSWIEKLFISAKDNQRVHKVLELVLKIYEERQKRISTGELNRFLEKLMERQPPPAVKARDLRLSYITQADADPPTFILFTRWADLMPDNYKLFLERQIRQNYGFDGVPIRMFFRSKRT